VLSRLFPTQAALLDAARGRGLAAIPDGEATRSGVALGDQVAAEIVALRSADKFEQSLRLEPYTPLKVARKPRQSFGLIKKQ